MTLASDSAENHHNKFGEEIHNLKCVCITYTTLYNSGKDCKHLMIANTLSGGKRKKKSINCTHFWNS